MRKVFLFAIINLCFLTHSIGQINWGYKVGLNVSRVRNSSQNDFTSNLGFNTGVLAKFKLEKKYFIKTEFLWSLKGFNSVLIPSGTTTTRFSYLTLPFLIEYQTANKFYFQLGPELNYLIAANMKNSTIDNSVVHSYRNFDISLSGGMGYNFSKKISLETRYIFGLSQINQKPDIFGSEHNRTFQINLLYWFK